MRIYYLANRSIPIIALEVDKVDNKGAHLDGKIIKRGLFALTLDKAKERALNRIQRKINLLENELQSQRALIEEVNNVRDDLCHSKESILGSILLNE